MEVFNLNIRPGKACPVLHCSQFDKGRMFRANLFDGAEVFTLTGSETLSVIEKKTDGNMVTIGVANTSDNYVVFGTTEQMTALAGCQLCELRIVDGEDLIGSLNFLLDCEESPDTGIESESAIHNLQEQIGEAVAEQYAAEDVVFDAAPVAGHGTGFAVTSEGVKTYVEGEIAALTIPEELDDLQDVELTSPTAGQIIEYDDNDGKWKNVANPASTTNFGAPYDENTTYNVPSLVIYNNLLYKLNDGEDGTTGPWDPTKWTQTNVAELAELIGSLSALTTTDKSSIVGAVNEVNEKETETLTYTSGGITASFKFNRFGNIVCVVGYNAGAMTLPTSWTNLTGTLSAKLRPTSALSLALITGDNHLIFLEINTNGTVRVYSNYSGNLYPSGTGIYVTT